MCSALSQKRLLTGVISQSHEKLNTSVAVSGDPPGSTKGLLNTPLLLQGGDCTDGCRRYLGGGGLHQLCGDLGHSCSDPLLLGERAMLSASTPASWTH